MTHEAESNGAKHLELGDIARIYRTWGRHPRLYAAQDLLTFLGRHRTIRRRAVAALQVGRGARVLEVAAGTGRNFSYIEDVIGPEGTLVALDYSGEMLDAAKALAARRGWHNIEFVQGDASRLEVGAAPFDAVLCVLGFSAMPGHLVALRRCRDVLRARGVLSVCDARPFSGLLSMLNPLLRAIYVPTTGWHPDRDVARDMEQVFGNVATETFNAGTFFVAWAQKREVQARDPA
jgi:ubiquinone/menaquinone biosynthesis C-methylase UbiE